MSVDGKIRVKHHLDKDPNDTRVARAKLAATAEFASLNDEPEAPVQVVEVKEVATRGGVHRIGVDPNDVRNLGPVENVSLDD